ncbi:hypothetical protein GCM10025762_52130 [Haloechinothrix salitolerans]
MLEVQQVDSHVSEPANLGEDLGDEPAGHVHVLDLHGRLQLNHDYLASRWWYFYTGTLALAGIEIPVVFWMYGSLAAHT